MFMAFTYWELRVNQHWPAPLALLVVLLVLSPLLGAVIERVLMRPLYNAPMTVTIVVTLALLLILLQVATAIWSPQEGRRLPEFFAGSDIQLAGVRVTYHQLITLGVAGLIATFRLIDAAQVVPTVFLFLIVVFLPQVRLAAGRLVGARAPRVPRLRPSLGWSAVFIAGLALCTTALSEFWLFNVGATLVIGIVILSLVLLSGYAGHISLMQMTFVGLGALTAGRLVGTGSVWGVLAAGAVAAAFGALVALPALRLQPLYLALTTLAVALFGDWVFSQRWGFGEGGTSSLTVRRLRLPGVKFTSEQSQVVL